MAKLRNGYILNLEEQDIKKAKEELNELNEETSTRIRDLRAALIQMKHVSIRGDDDFLLMFLRNAMFSQDEALAAIEHLAKLRMMDPYQQIYTNTAQLSPAVKEQFEKGIVFITPQFSEYSGRAMIMRPGLIDTNTISALQYLEACMVTLEVALLDPVTQIHGLQKVMDFRGCGLMKAATLYSPSAIQVAGATCGNSLPLITRGYQLCFTPLLVHGAFSLIKPLYSREVSRSFYSHRSEGSLHSAVDPRTLPEELGGTAGTCEDLAQQWYLHVTKHLDYFRRFSSTAYDVNKKE